MSWCRSAFNEGNDWGLDVFVCMLNIRVSKLNWVIILMCWRCPFKVFFPYEGVRDMEMRHTYILAHSNFQQKILKTSEEFNLLLLLPSPILKENREILQELILFTNKHFPKNGFNNPERKVSKSMGLLSQCIILKSFL